MVINFEAKLLKQLKAAPERLKFCLHGDSNSRKPFLYIEFDFVPFANASHKIIAISWNVIYLFQKVYHERCQDELVERLKQYLNTHPAVL